MNFPLRPFLNCVIAGGLVVAGLPLGQTIYGKWNQRVLAAQFEASKEKKTSGRNFHKKTIQKADRGKTSTNPATTASDSSPALTISDATHAKRAPWPLTKLSIPDIGLETFVVQGMDAAALRRGPGHDINSSPPGQGNCVVAGHRNVYGSFFYHLDELLPGAPITLENRAGKWTYVVDTTFTTPATNLTVLNPPAAGAAPLLTLVTCTLPHTSNRIILQARLSSGE